MIASGKGDPRKSGTIWVRDLDDSLPVVRPVVEAVFCRVQAEQASLLAEAMDTSHQAEALSRLQTGRHCHAALVQGHLAAYGWVSFDSEHVGELNLQVRLPAGEAYIWDCLTLPEYRQKGLYSSLLSSMLQELRGNGFRRVWIGADLDNEPSQRGIAKAGFQFVAEAVVARVLAVRMVWLQGRPGASEHLVDEARRVFLGNRDSVWQEIAATSRAAALEARPRPLPVTGRSESSQPPP